MGTFQMEFSFNIAFLKMCTIIISICTFSYETQLQSFIKNVSQKKFFASPILIRIKLEFHIIETINFIIIIHAYKHILNSDEPKFVVIEKI